VGFPVEEAGGSTCENAAGASAGAHCRLCPGAQANPPPCGPLLARHSITRTQIQVELTDPFHKETFCQALPRANRVLNRDGVRADCHLVRGTVLRRQSTGPTDNRECDDDVSHASSELNRAHPVRRSEHAVPLVCLRVSVPFSTSELGRGARRCCFGERQSSTPDTDGTRREGRAQTDCEPRRGPARVVIAHAHAFTILEAPSGHRRGSPRRSSSRTPGTPYDF
jgi:hypothetical protein